MSTFSDVPLYFRMANPILSPILRIYLPNYLTISSKKLWHTLRTEKTRQLQSSTPRSMRSPHAAPLQMVNFCTFVFISTFLELLISILLGIYIPILLDVYISHST